MNDRKMGVIEALLAKAESTTPEEAEALTAKAEALMIKYGIEAAVIAARRASGTGEPEQIVTRTLTFAAGRYATSLMQGSYAVALAMSGGSVNAYRTTWRKSIELVLVGFSDDLDQAELLINSLGLQAIVARDAWWKSYPSRKWLTQQEGFVERRSFIEQFFRGAAARLKQERVIAETEAIDNEPGTAVALRDRKAAVDAHLMAMGLRKGRGGSRSYGSAGGNAGYRAGQSANVGTRGVGAGYRAVGA